MNKDQSRATHAIQLIAIVAISWTTSVLRAQPPSPVNSPVGFSQHLPGLVLWDQCGWEGARACTSNDPIFNAVHASEYGGTFFQPGTGCDLTLRPNSSGICTDMGGRHSPHRA
jgi:hypothetical protein